MLTALKYKKVLLEKFYLDSDDITIRRSCDGYHGRYKRGDVVTTYKMTSDEKRDYRAIHIPGARTSITLPWLLTILRGFEFNESSVIDHKDGDITNNSRCNIRVTTQKINCRNSSRRLDNTTGYTGISYNKNAKLYTIRRTINGKRIYRSSRDISGAIAHLEELTILGLKNGYTERHGQEGATTIPKGSTPQAIGGGSARHPSV